MKPSATSSIDLAARDQLDSRMPSDFAHGLREQFVQQGNLHFDKRADGFPVGTPYCPECLAKEILVHTVVNPTNECVVTCPKCHAVAVNYLLAAALPKYASVLKRPR